MIARYLSCLLVLVLSASILQADVINIDFGDTAYTGSDAGPAGISASWNAFKDGDNEITIGDVTIDAGNGSWGNDPQDDTQSVGGVMAVSGLYDDLLQSGHASNWFGVRVNGLAAGTYDVYLIPHDDGVGDGTFITLGQGDSSVDQRSEITTNAVTADGNDLDTTLDSWTPSGTDTAFNYMKTTVTITDSANDYIIAMNDPSNKWGFAAMQIVPEPATMALLGIGGLAILRRRRK